MSLFVAVVILTWSGCAVQMMYIQDMETDFLRQRRRGGWKLFIRNKSTADEGFDTISIF